MTQNMSSNHGFPTPSSLFPLRKYLDHPYLQGRSTYLSHSRSSIPQAESTTRLMLWLLSAPSLSHLLVGRNNIILQQSGEAERLQEETGQVLPSQAQTLIIPPSGGSLLGALISPYSKHCS